MMEFFAAGAAGRRSEPSRGPYTGEIWREMLHEGPGPVVGNVFFTPCARTNWHTHPEGQLLIAVVGRGIVAGEDQVINLSQGEMVWTPPNMLHWHGASADHFFLHTAITPGGVEWGNPVTDEEFAAAASEWRS